MKFSAFLTTCVLLLTACSQGIEYSLGQTAVASTSIAKSWTATPAATVTPAATATPQPSPTPTPLPVDVSAQVTDKQGKPLDGATITLIEGKDKKLTDASGQAVWKNLGKETISLFVTDQGYTPKGENLTLKPGNNSIAIALERDPFGLLPAELLKPGEKLLYIDDFQDGKSKFQKFVGDWRVIDDPDQIGNKVIECGLDTSSNNWSTAKINVYEQPELIIEYNILWVDLNYKDQNNATGFDFRPGYALAMAPYWRLIQIVDFRTSTWKFPFEKQRTYKSNTWYKVRLEVIGDKVSTFLDNKAVGRLGGLEENGYKKGNDSQMGFAIGAGATVRIDNVVIKAPAP